MVRQSPGLGGRIAFVAAASAVAADASNAALAASSTVAPLTLAAAPSAIIFLPVEHEDLDLVMSLLQHGARLR
jgi:hypothetical protein